MAEQPLGKDIFSKRDSILTVTKALSKLLNLISSHIFEGQI